MFDSKNEEMIPIAGDLNRTGAVRQRHGVADPIGERGAGAAQQINLDHAKVTAVIRYRDKLIEADVYALPGEPVKVVILCPRCNNASSIDETRKAIDWRPHPPQAVGDFVNHGKLSIEPFECSWELPDAGAHNQSARETLIGTAPLCRLKIGVTNNIGRDA